MLCKTLHGLCHLYGSQKYLGMSNPLARIYAIMIWCIALFNLLMHYIKHSHLCYMLQQQQKQTLTPKSAPDIRQFLNFNDCLHHLILVKLCNSYIDICKSPVIIFSVNNPTFFFNYKIIDSIYHLATCLSREGKEINRSSNRDIFSKFLLCHTFFNWKILIILNFTFVFRMKFLLFWEILIFKMFSYLLKQSNR